MLYDVYSFNNAVLICFITGISSVKAVSVSSSVFTSGGTLTLGQLTPGLSVDIAMGTFNGYIDEVRVWSRPHNPTIITNNFRVTVTSDTSDLTHNWNFNEGIGFTAYESKLSENMIVVDTQNTPIWVISDLELSENNDLDRQKITTEVEISAAELQAAEDTCHNLMNNFSQYVTGSTIELLTEVHDDLCVKELTSTADPAQADAVLAGAADLYISIENSSSSPLLSMCNLVDSIADYIGAGGDSCSACVFGGVQNGTCVCLNTHWGLTCTEICPVGSLGACNTYGVCASDIGICNCYPRHYSSSVTVTDVWREYVSSSKLNISSDYTCKQCSENWVGNDCQFAKSSILSYTGMVYGSYLTTFDGISFTHVTPGVYSLIKTSSVNVQCLFLPCLGTNLCRYMKELTVRKGSTTLTIQHNYGENVTVILQGEELQYPVTQSSGEIEIKWTEDPFIKVMFSSSYIIVYDSDIGLVTSAKIHADIAKVNQGLLGSADGIWTNDIQCEDETETLNADDVTGIYAGECIRKRYIPKASDIIISHEYATERFSSGGYALSLAIGQTFSVSGFTVEEGISAFTISFWAKYTVITTTTTVSSVSYTLLSVDVGATVLTFQVASGFVAIDWITTNTTALSISSDTWYFFSFSWQSSDGAVVMHMINNGALDTATFTINAGADINIEEIKMKASANARVTIDCIRVWAKTKTENEVLTDMDIYGGYSDSDKMLMLSLAFDEGHGATASVTTYQTNNGTMSGSVIGMVTGNISGKFIHVY